MTSDINEIEPAAARVAPAPTAWVAATPTFATDRDIRRVTDAKPRRERDA
jgi:hypothetical protein